MLPIVLNRLSGRGGRRGGGGVTNPHITYIESMSDIKKHAYFFFNRFIVFTFRSKGEGDTAIKQAYLPCQAPCFQNVSLSKTYIYRHCKDRSTCALRRTCTSLFLLTRLPTSVPNPILQRQSSQLNLSVICVIAAKTNGTRTMEDLGGCLAPTY